ncbi:MAG: twin-arginine translocase TatA/TatE family subunit [Spirochaetia bacterium]|nr:twin-arginine translocase TatA/TatE family subunit [Spirochaetia bacterium]
MLGSTEIIVLVGVGLVLFGASAIPKFARSLGQAKHEFEKGQKEEEEKKQAEKESQEDGADPGKTDSDTKGKKRE